MQRRMTTQKKIVYNAIKNLGHATIEDIISYTNLHQQRIPLATIYRNIQVLTADNLIKLVKLNGHDVLETVKEDHIHFVCEVCGSIYDMGFNKKKMIKNNFKTCIHQIHQCDIAFYGVCQNCKNKEEEKNEVCL